MIKIKELSMYEKVGNIENNFTVKFRVYEKNYPLIPHWHEHIEILYMVYGECDATCEGKSAHLKKGDFLIANSTEIHTFINQGKIKYYSILIYPEFFSDVKFDGVTIQNFIFQDHNIEYLMNSIYNEYVNANDAFDLMIKSHTYALMAYLMRHYSRESLSLKDLQLRKMNLNRLGKVLEFISENYAERISTSVLADMCYLSEAHFCRFFKDKIGQTVMSYINSFRIEKACVLLKSTDENISVIAQNVGFDDFNYFSRVFKKLKGVTASQYKNNYLSNHEVFPTF